MIFSTVLGPQDPAVTVGSLAIRQTGRPPIVARPVTTPSAPKPSCSQFARRASSANEPASTRRSTRSRTGSLPCSADFARWRSGPPARARSSASFRSDTSLEDNAGPAPPREGPQTVGGGGSVAAVGGGGPGGAGGGAAPDERPRGASPSPNAAAAPRSRTSGQPTIDGLGFVLATTKIVMSVDTRPMNPGPRSRDIAP